MTPHFNSWILLSPLALFVITNKDKKDQSGGGIAINHKKNISVMEIDSFTYNTFECLTANINTSNNKTLICHLIYHPSGNTPTLTKHLSDLIAHCSLRDMNNLILGDLNLHWNEESNDNTRTNATTITSEPSTITTSPTTISPVMTSQTNTTYSSPTTSGNNNTRTNATTISSVPSTITTSPTTISPVMTRQTNTTYSRPTTSGHDNTTTNATTISSAPSTITSSPTTISPVMTSQTNTTYSGPKTSGHDNTMTNATTISSAPSTNTASPTTISPVMTNQTNTTYSSPTNSGHNNTMTNATTIASASSTSTASPTTILPMMTNQTNTTYSSPTTSASDSSATNAIMISSAPNIITAGSTTMSTVVTNQTISIDSTATTSVNCQSRSINMNGTCECEFGYYGPSCLYEEKPCKNGSYDGIQCVCDEGFSGTLCEYPAGVCLNGGYLNGSKCICTNFFTGEFCELLTDIASVETIDARINVVVKINEDFNANLLNKNSEEYRIFVRDFKTVMLDVYKNVIVFKDIDIYDISNGSIVVNHSVIVALNYSLDLTQAYYDTLNQLQEAIDNATQFQEPCNAFKSGMCFNSSFTKITSSDVPVKTGGATRIARAFTKLETKSVIVNPVEICRGLVPGSFRNYIHNISDNWSLFCVSSCYPGLVNGVNCHYGTCLVLNSGPECQCPNTDTYLYYGKNCETRLHRPSLIGGLTVAAFVIILIVVAVLTFFCRRRYRQRNGSYYLREINDKNRLFRENSGVFMSAKPRPSRQEASHSNIRSTIIPNFKLYLDTLETSIKMVIKRPQIVKNNNA
ncbi:uncharacterized protein LOC144783294 [Lissotriton helveticus]